MGKSPIIIIGMHRSGTTMLAKILEAMGVYQGSFKDENNESIYFMNINKWILSLAGASWDNPVHLKRLENHPQHREIVKDRIQFFLNSFLRYRYFGKKSILSLPSFFNTNMNWGWKDPRNTFTLPYWLDIFPDAKILYISRHGVDVANSLVTRENKIFSDNLHQNFRNLNKLASLHLPIIRGSMLASGHCSKLSDAFNLWETYMKQGDELINKMGSQILNLKYESVLDEPLYEITKLEEFLELKIPENQRDKIVFGINKPRLFAYKNDSELLNFSKSVKNALNQFGYDH